MACFSSITTKKVLVHIENSIAYFADSKDVPLGGIENSAISYFKDREATFVKFPIDLGQLEEKFENENLALHYTRNMTGMSLLELQTFLELNNGSVLVPLSRTKTSYVYIQGQRDYDGSEIG